MGSLRRIPDRNLQDKPKDISNDIVKTNTRQHEDSSNSIAIEVRLDQNGCAKTGAVHRDVTSPDDDYHKEAYINDDEIHKTVNDDIINISPDGGWGWVVCFGLFILIALQDGTVIAFGVLQLEFLDYFGESKSKTALISSLNIGISMVMGIFVAMLLERFSCRQVIILGAIVTMIAFTLSVFAYSVTYLILTIGIMAGIGMGLSYIPATVIVCLYFNKKRALAMGLASSGSGVGQLVYAFLVGPLIEEYSWRGTLLIMAGLLFHMAICGALFRPLVPRQNGVNVHTWRMHCLNIFRTLKCLYFTKSNVDSTTVVINPNRDIHIDGKNEANASEIMLLKGTNNLTTSRDVVSVPMTLQHVQAHLPNHLENDNDEDGSGTSLRHGCGVNEDGIATDYTLGYDTPDIIRQGYLNPYLRKDILYCGSLKSLPEFSETGSMQSFLVSMTNLSYWGESLSIQKIESLHEQDMISIQPDIVKVENPKLLDFSLFRDKTYLLLLTAMFMWARPAPFSHAGYEDMHHFIEPNSYWIVFAITKGVFCYLFIWY